MPQGVGLVQRVHGIEVENCWGPSALPSSDDSYISVSLSLSHIFLSFFLSFSAVWNVRSVQRPKRRAYDKDEDNLLEDVDFFF